MASSLLNQGVMLMLVGMGTVFVFLTLLVATISLVSTAVKRLAPASAPVLAASDATDEEVAAITAAITRHRNNYTR